MYCPKCGSQAQQGRFCRSCGTNLAVVSDVMGQPPRSASRAASGGGGSTLAIFHPQAISNQHTSLNGHQAVGVFGQVALDLTAAALELGDNRVSVFSIFSHSYITIPENVPVRITGFAVFSAAGLNGGQFGNGFISSLDFKSPGYDNAATRIHLDLSAIFGAIYVATRT